MSADQRIQDLEIKVRSLENENRILRANVWDGYFKAACQATLHHGAKTGVAAAVEVADLMLAARLKRFSLGSIQQVDQALQKVERPDGQVKQAKESKGFFRKSHQIFPMTYKNPMLSPSTNDVLPAEFHDVKKGGDQ